MKKKISFVLAVLLLLGSLLTACGSGETGGDYGKKLENKFLLSAGKTEYVLVIPQKGLGRETLAAEEFNHFFELATGATLEVVTDDKLPQGKKFISLGRTSQFFDAFSEKDLEPLADTYSAYFMASKDDNIYIASDDTYNGSAVLYGVYDLLHDLVDYVYYHDQEIAYTESDTVNLWQYEKHVVKPSFDMRTHSTLYIYSNEYHNYRLRYTRFSPSDEWDQATIGHSQITMFVSPIDDDPDTGDTYGISHPEWFFDPTATKNTKNNNQLCWTAGGNEESRQKLLSICAERMSEYVLMNPDANFFMFGQMDTEYVCQCEGCRKALNEWGGSACGLQIAFVNELIEKTQVILKENNFNDRVLYAIYAYKPTVEAPAKQDENGNFVPYSDKVIPHEDLRIFYAPIRANFGFPLDAPYNAETYKELHAWDAVCDKKQLMTYLYDLNVRYYFANFYNVGTIASMYQDLQAAGVDYMLSQGVSDTMICCFDELRAYCISSLMWDTSRSFLELTEDFMANYYKDAGDAMLELYEMIRDRNATYVAVTDPGSATPDGVIYKTDLYPRAFVERMDDQIEKALSAIEHLKDSDPEQYELLKARIMKEYLSNIYLKMALYEDSYSETEIRQMEKDWNTYIAYWNITKGGEGNGLPDLFG